MNPPSPIVHTVKKVMPAVVSIAISKTVQALEKDIPQEILPFIPFDKNHHLKIPKEMLDGHGMLTVGSGSGFIVAPNGIIITNKHVIADAHAEYTVLTNDERKFTAHVIARDPIDDIAILKIEADHLPTVTLGDSSRAELGEPVLAIGNALGLFKNTVSYGIISGLSRAIRAGGEADPRQPMQELRGLIQTDAAINPGNSGGPLVNMEGQAIGINAAVVFGAQNLGFAIPMNAAKRDLADLETHGRIRRPLLGLRYIMITEGIKTVMKLPVAEGALIVSHLPHTEAIIPGSPAAKAGLKEKDIVLACNNEKLSANKTIQDILEEKEVGETLKLKVLRGKKEIEMKVVLAERK